MLAATATATDPKNPLDGLEVGERPDPQARDGWEVVQVRATTVNHHDIWSLRGVGLPDDQLPRILGCDAAGITSDGREVVIHSVITEDGTDDPYTQFSIFSERYDGTHAELLAVPSRNLIEKPASLSFEEAACLPTAWLTAYRMLFTQAQLRPGQRVLVQGAGGGVATAAITLGRAAGLKVYATSRSEEKRAKATELGAHEVLESGARLPERVDAVIETVGEATWAHSLRSLEAGGVVVVAGSTSGPNPSAELQRVFFRQLRVVGSTMGTRAEFTALLRMLDASGVRPEIDSVRPLSEAAQAYAQMAQGELFGKLVLTP